MNTESKDLPVPEEAILNKIYQIRGLKVMLDFDLATLYGVETRQLKRAVRRNIERFPDDFMFELTAQELENLRRQIGASSWGGIRYVPMAFTEQGVAMLSSVLKSKIAISVNIMIMRIFSRMRKFLETHSEILLQLKELKDNDFEHERKFEIIFEYIRQMEEVKSEEKKFTERKRIGY